MANPRDESADLYDEPMTDQDPRENSSESEEDGDYSQTFLAPKAAFKGDVSPGTVHRVRIEASHDEELELVCLGTESEKNDSDMSEESNPLYE